MLVWFVVVLYLFEYVLLTNVMSGERYVSSLDGKRMTRVDDIYFSRASSCSGSCLHVDVSVTDQEMDGFGGSFLRSGAFTLNRLPKDKQTDVLAALFSSSGGAGLSVGKVPIGACDYCPLRAENATAWWSYRERESDPFSLGPDLEEPGGTIPFIRRAAAVADEPLLLQATMDYAPAWMQSGQLPKSSVNPAFYDELANYYLDFARQFQQHAGFPLHYISLFNEPHDSYTWIPMDQIATLLAEHVGPLFHRHRPALTTGLTYASQSSRNMTWLRTPGVLKRPDVLKYTDVLMYHGYDCSPWQCAGANITCPQLDETVQLIARLHADHPTLRLWMTECIYAIEYNSYVSPPCPMLPFVSFTSALQWAKMIVADLRAGASAWIYWNMVLDQTGGPHMTNPLHNDPKFDVQQPLVLVDTGSGQVSYTGAYWALAHFGRFVRRGATRVQSTGSPSLSVNLYHVAFTDQWRQTLTVQLVNDSPASTAVNLFLATGGGQVTSLVLDPVSITTIVIRYPPGQ